MLARSEQVTGVPGVADEYYGYYNDASAFGACSYHSRYALYDGFQSGGRDGKPVAPLMGHMKGYDGGAGDFQMGPLTFMLNYPDHCVLYRFIPKVSLKPIWNWFGMSMAMRWRGGLHREELTWLWHNTTLEDEFIILRNSEGVNSQFLSPAPSSEHESTLNEFVTWYLKALSQVQLR